jgi:hypothetical protein
MRSTCSYCHLTELQPLDVDVFAQLERALAREADKVSRLDSGWISRVELTEMYIRVCYRALTMENICSVWGGLLVLSR